MSQRDNHEDWQAEHNWGTMVGGIIVCVILLYALYDLVRFF